MSDRMEHMDESADLRVGNPERERALSDLSAHLGAGRLSVAEFDERSAQLVRATTRRDIAAVFTDLPALAPAQAEVAEQVERDPAYRRVMVLAAAALVTAALTVGQLSWLWFLLLIPAVRRVLVRRPDPRHPPHRRHPAARIHELRTKSRAAIHQ